MLNGRRFSIDTMVEVYELLKHFADEEFWNFQEQVTVQPNTIYLLGRQQFLDNLSRIRELSEDPSITIVFGGSAEGSITLSEQCRHHFRIGDLLNEKKISVIGGGETGETSWHHLLHDHFLCRILDFEQNLPEMERLPEIYAKTKKPYKFMFLNGRGRPHRKFLWERFRQEGLLEQSIWTMMEGRAIGNRHFTVREGDVDCMTTYTPIRHLPPEYEIDRYRDSWEKFRTQSTWAPWHNAKMEIFNKEWGEIYLRAEPYIDTYFSVVTETVCEHPYSFRTEKIAKVLAQGHPWICATSQGFYRDLRNLGFQTFGGIIDESFDDIENHHDRMERIVQIVKELCSNDLESFLAECEPVCKYNQQRLREFQQEHRAAFPSRFQEFLANDRS